jgi:hypothetical protein
MAWSEWSSYLKKLDEQAALIKQLEQDAQTAEPARQQEQQSWEQSWNDLQGTLKRIKVLEKENLQLRETRARKEAGLRRGEDTEMQSSDEGIEEVPRQDPQSLQTEENERLATHGGPSDVADVSDEIMLANVRRERESSELARTRARFEEIQLASMTRDLTSGDTACAVARLEALSNTRREILEDEVDWDDDDIGSPTRPNRTRSEFSADSGSLWKVTNGGHVGLVRTSTAGSACSVSCRKFYGWLSIPTSFSQRALMSVFASQWQRLVRTPKQCEASRGWIVFFI